MESIKDYEGLSKEDLIENLKNVISNIERLEKDNCLLDNTEKDRVRLLKENNELKGELSKLRFVKDLLDKVGVYGYEDYLTFTKNQHNIRLNSHKEKERVRD